MKRLGIRKLATAVFNTKLVQGVDKVMNFAHRAPGDVIKTVADKTGVSKLKVDVSGKASRKKANASLKSKMELVNKKLIEQEARDIKSSKDFERENGEITIPGMQYADRDTFKYAEKVTLDA